MVIDPANFTPGNMVLGAFDPATNRGVVQLTDCDPTAPRSDRMTTCYWVAPWPTIRPTGARWSSTRRPGISSMWAGSSVRTKCGSTKVMGGTTRAPTGTANRRPCVRPILRTKLPCWGGRRGNQLPDRDDSQSSGSHSVAADSKRNLIFVPQNAAAGTGRDTTNVGAGICGGNNGASASSCIMSTATATTTTGTIATGRSRPLSR